MKRRPEPDLCGCRKFPDIKRWADGTWACYCASCGKTIRGATRSRVVACWNRTQRFPGSSKPPLPTTRGTQS